MIPILLLLIGAALASPVSATLRITEIYPAPSAGNYEWIEIYNGADTAYELEGVIFADEKDNRLIPEEIVVPAGGYTIATAQSTLNNTGDTVFIKSPEGEVIDSVSYIGTFDKSLSFALCESEWKINQNPTPKSSNAPACIVNPTPAASLATNPPSPIPIKNISISEVMVYPSEQEFEWVELYNANDYEVLLEKWHIDDLENAGGSPKQFTIRIPAGGYGTIDLSAALFNNDGDTVRLLDNDRLQVDSIIYTEKPPQGMSIGRADLTSSAVCAQPATKELPNVHCLPSPTPSSHTPLSSPPTPSPTKAQTPTISATSTSYPTSDPLMRQKTASIIPLASLSAYISSPKTGSSFSQVLGVSHTSPAPPGLASKLALCALIISVLTIGAVLVKIKVSSANG